MLPEIIISCKGATTVSLAELNNLQGELKNLAEEDYVKLRNSIIEYGFSFPIFYWQDQEGKKWIIDAHQRQRTLLKMQEEGYTIPPLPADEILAKDKVEAKKKLLLLNSRYGKVTDTGMSDFLNETDSPIQFEEISDLLTFPEADFNAEENQQGGAGQPREVECPNCHTKFDI